MMNEPPKVEFWKEGANAHIRQVPKDSNPYHYKTRPLAYSQWLRGWEDAEKFAFLMSYVGPVQHD